MHGKPRWLLWLPGLLLLALVVDGAWVTYGLRTRLTEVAEKLQAGGAELAAGRVHGAQKHFAGARSSARAAVDLTGHPSFVLASMPPWIGPNSVAVQALTGTADLSAEAGYSAVAARRRLGQDPASSLYGDGRVHFGPLEAARPYLVRAQRSLFDAASTVHSAPRPTVSPIYGAVRSARSQLASATNTARRLTLVAESLPELLGRNGSRRYLLAFQTPSEARGTSGLIGFYGVLTARDGRVGLERVAPISNSLAFQPRRSMDPSGSWIAMRPKAGASCSRWSTSRRSFR